LPRGSRISADPAGRVVPADRSLVANDVTGAAVSALNIIQMDFSDRPVRELEQDGRRVLRIDFEPAEFAAETSDRLDLAEHPTHVVNFMDRIQDHASAQRAAGAVTLAI